MTLGARDPRNARGTRKKRASDRFTIAGCRTETSYFVWESTEDIEGMLGGMQRDERRVDYRWCMMVDI